MQMPLAMTSLNSVSFAVGEERANEPRFTQRSTALPLKKQIPAALTSALS